MSTNEESKDEDVLGRLKNQRSIVCKALKRAEIKKEKQEKELVEVQSALRYQHYADTILAGIGAVAKGMSECLLPDIHDGSAQVIPLNPALSPQDNAAMYYRKAKKARRGLEIVQENIDQTRTEIAGLEHMCSTIETNIQKAHELDLESGLGLMQEAIDQNDSLLAEWGIIPRQRAETVKKHNNNVSVPFRRLTVEGWEIFIGRNDQQNDELSTRFAKPWDLWLHVAGHAGSHVVIRRQKNSELPPKKIIEIVAAFSVWYSKAKHTSYAEVHVTERRFVRKRRGAPAGEVIAEQCKTVRVAPCNPQEFFKDKAVERDEEAWG